MRWLWFVAPMVVALIALLLTFVLTPEEKRLRKALKVWLEQLAGPLRSGKKTRSRRVKRLQPAFANMVEAAGGGARIGDAVLLPKEAYLAARAASADSGSQHVTVVGRLAKQGPALVARPLPIYDGAAAENTGIRFSKDPAFMDDYVVEGTHAKAIGTWLTPDVRDALLDFPSVWLRVDGGYFSATLYGTPSADDVDELVNVADAVYAEHGYDPEQSLLGQPAQSAEQPRKSQRALRDGHTRKKKRRQRQPDGALSQAASAQLRLSCAALDIGLYLACLALAAMVLGKLSMFHPAALFNSPDLIVNEPWQGGWTTKGFGALVAVESLLLGLVALQAYLTAVRGQSLGKMLFGAKLVDKNGNIPSFNRGVALRQWLWALPPLVIAASRAKPFNAGTFFEQVPSRLVLGVAVGLLVLAAASAVAGGGRGLHDRLAGTHVVTAPAYKLVTLQLGASGHPDPIISGRLTVLGALFTVMAGLSVAYLLGVSFWIF